MFSKKQKKQLTRILLSGALLLLLGVLSLAQCLPQKVWVRLPLFLIPYFLVGWGVWKKSISNLLHGQLLDENFLMSVATVGAFALGEYHEAVFVMLFYQVGELFESVAVGKSRRSIAALMDICPDEARVLREGAEVLLSPDEVEVGELMLVRPGERIALDGVIEQGESALDTASLTGEALPRAVKPGDEVFSGCINLGGLLSVRATRCSAESTVTKILELVEHSTLVKSKTETTVTRFAHWYTPAVVVAAVLLALIPSLITGEWQSWVRSALIFLVVSCPCALVISVPLSYFGGLGCASRHGVLVKGANWLETLARAETVVFDKTGTLTEGEFCVTGLKPAPGMTAESLLRLAATAERHSNHPIARSLCRACEEMGARIGNHAEDVREMAGLGVLATVDGKRVAVGSRELMRREGVRDELLTEAVDGTAVYLAVDGAPCGVVLLSDRIKPEALEAMAALRQSGVSRLLMLTGDREEKAISVAEALGLDGYRAELLPADKVACVEELLKEARGTLAFVGDGINDAPVLARADVGIAMGAMGADSAIEAADVVLMDDNPARLADAIHIARFTERIVRQNIAFALGIKGLFLLLSLFRLTNLWAATFADVGVAVIAILNAMRTLRAEKK